jgi:hypothetical protein
MTTARDVITRAYQKAHVIARGETPVAEQIEPALETFNDMLEEWRDHGIDLGLATLGLDDDVGADAGAMRAIVYNLAVELANDEHAAIPAATAAIAERSYNRLAAREVPVEAPRFDPALTRNSVYDINAG